MGQQSGSRSIGMQLNTQGEYLMIVSEKGMGKLTHMNEFTAQNRGGKGVKCYKIMEKTGNVIGVKAVNKENEIMIISTEGIVIRMMCGDISVLGRVTSGVKLINMDVDNDIMVASIAKVRESSNQTEEDMLKSLEEELLEEESLDGEVVTAGDTAPEEEAEASDSSIDSLVERALEEKEKEEQEAHENGSEEELINDAAPDES